MSNQRIEEESARYITGENATTLSLAVGSIASSSALKAEIVTDTTPRSILFAVAVVAGGLAFKRVFGQEQEQEQHSDEEFVEKVDTFGQE